MLIFKLVFQVPVTLWVDDVRILGHTAVLCLQYSSYMYIHMI